MKATRSANADHAGNQQKQYNRLNCCVSEQQEGNKQTNTHTHAHRQAVTERQRKGNSEEDDFLKIAVRIL